MNHSKRFGRIAASIFFGTAVIFGSSHPVFSAPAANGGNLEVFAPCATATTVPGSAESHLHACDSSTPGAQGFYYINGIMSSPNLPYTSATPIPTPSSLVSIVQKILQNQVDCLYPTASGGAVPPSIDLNVSTLSNPGPASLPASGQSCQGLGQVVPRPCSFEPTQFTKDMSEINTDHTGYTCGQPSYLSANVSTSPLQINVNYNYAYNATVNQNFGQWERSHMSGYYVQALDARWTAIKNNLLSRRSVVIQKFTTPQGTQVPNPCQGLATAFTTSSGQYASTAQAEVSALQHSQYAGNLMNNATNDMTNQIGVKNGVNMTDIDFCQNQNIIVGSDVGPLRQRAQQLCAMRASLEATFAQLVACEVNAEANFIFADYIVPYEQGKITGTTTLAQVQKNVSEPCRQEYKNGSCNSPQSPSLPAGNYNTCYETLNQQCLTRNNCAGAATNTQAATCAAECAPTAVPSPPPGTSTSSSQYQAYLAYVNYENACSFIGGMNANSGIINGTQIAQLVGEGNIGLGECVNNCYQGLIEQPPDSPANPFNFLTAQVTTYVTTGVFQEPSGARP